MIAARATALRRSGLLPGLLMLIVVVALNAWLQPKLFGAASLDSNIATFAPTIMICVAQALIVLGGELDLSVGAGVSLLNCVMASLPTDSVAGACGVAALALVLALALGTVNGVLVGFAGLPSLIATFATGAIWYGMALVLMPQPGGTIADPICNFYADTVSGLPVPLLIVAAGMVLVVLLLHHRLGRRMLAVGSNPTASYRSGIPVPAIKLAAYVAGWGLVFLSALSISAQTSSGDAGVGQTYTLTSVAAVVIGGISLAGGRGSPWGALIGAVVLGIIANVIYFAGIPSIWQECFKGLVIVAALAFMVIEQRTAVAA
jgi:ribose transport system permease protein